eukprot:3466503-Pleurochrysis_carterae.AAC.2
MVERDHGLDQGRPCVAFVSRTRPGQHRACGRAARRRGDRERAKVVAQVVQVARRARRLHGVRRRD